MGEGETVNSIMRLLNIYRKSDDGAVQEVPPAEVLNDAHGLFFGHSLPVRTVLHERSEHVGDHHDSRSRVEILGPAAEGISGAIEPFMVIRRPFGDLPEPPNRHENRIGEVRPPDMNPL